MNDKEFNGLKNKIDRLMTKWRLPMGIGWWTVHRIYEREYADDDNKYGSDCHKGASCSVQYPYKTATIKFFMPALINESKDELERIIVHELTHILVNEMRDFEKGIEHEERVVSDLTSAFFWLEDKFRKTK